MSKIKRFIADYKLAKRINAGSPIIANLDASGIELAAGVTDMTLYGLNINPDNKLKLTVTKNKGL